MPSPNWTALGQTLRVTWSKRPRGLVGARIATAVAKVPPAARPKAAGLAVVVALLAVYGAAQVARLWSQRSLVSTDDAYVTADIVSVTPRVSGTIVRVLVTDDQPVHAGELLATLDDRDLQARRRQAGAVVDAANARINAVRARSALQNAAIAQAKADETAAEADAERAGLSQTHIAQTSADAASAGEGASANHKKAAALVQRAKASVEAADLQAGVLATQEREAEASLAQAKAAVASADLALSYCEIRSPVDGVVGSRAARIGALAATGVALFAIVPTDGRWIEANFKETQIKDIVPGTPATIEVDGLPGATLQGTVRGIAPASGSAFSIVPTENATGNFTKIVQRVPVRVDLERADGRRAELRPGLSAIVHLDPRGAPTHASPPALPPPVSSRSQGAS